MLDFDLIIIGAGPAGMSAAVYASRAAHRVLMLEQMAPGGKLMLTSEVENYPGFRQITGAELADDMFKHAQAFGASYESAQIERILCHGEDDQRYFEVQARKKSWTARAVIIASGTKEKKLGIPGEEEYYGMGVSYCAVCDGAFFRDKELIVIGGGSTAFEDALYLTKFASKVTIAMRRDVSRAEQLLQKRVAAEPKIERQHWWVPQEILAEQAVVKGVRFQHAQTGEIFTVPCAAVFPLVGVLPNNHFVDPALLNESGYIVTDDRMRTAIPGLFAAGDIRHKQLRQIVTASSDGAIAAEEAGHYLDSLAGREVVRRGEE